MKRAIIILYWILAIALIASVLVCIGYRLSEAVFIAALFLPGALAVKYFFSKVTFTNKAEGIKNCVFITLGVIAGEIFLFILAHWTICKMRADTADIYEWSEVPKLLVNPVFIAIMIGAFSVLNVLLEKWLDKKYPSGPKTITFLSDRKPVSLSETEILYIESNDSVTTVYASDGRQFRNKTPISQWEASLGDKFVRIHRSYLVNRSAITSVEAGTVIVGDRQLPVSRKYKDHIN
ncbi:MAG: LytTR family transcriptional regulator [Bacteroidales bacterium]|nr:LytTR family transcriptional regulator [Bacteroidales bacterium]